MERKDVQGTAGAVAVGEDFGGFDGFLLRVQARFDLVSDHALGERLRRREGGSRGRDLPRVLPPPPGDGRPRHGAARRTTPPAGGLKTNADAIKLEPVNLVDFLNFPNRQLFGARFILIKFTPTAPATQNRYFIFHQFNFGFYPTGFAVHPLANFINVRFSGRDYFHRASRFDDNAGTTRARAVFYSIQYRIFTHKYPT